MDILSRLYTGNREQAFEDIMTLYTQQGRGVVSFLYFANVMHHRLLEPTSDKANKSPSKEYKNALESADFLLPDGIALQTFQRFNASTLQRLSNLNGTDFIPYFIDRLVEQGKKVHIGLYSVYDPKIGKTQEEGRKALQYIEDRWALNKVWFLQALYSERGDNFDFESYADELEHSDAEIKILLLCTGTPHQEIWTQEHRDFFEKNIILVFNAGGLVDYRSGFEKRAPAWVRKARVLETPWRILQHPKKNFKKLRWMGGILRWRRGKILGKN